MNCHIVSAVRPADAHPFPHLNLALVRGRACCRHRFVFNWEVGIVKIVKHELCAEITFYAMSTNY